MFRVCCALIDEPRSADLRNVNACLREKRTGDEVSVAEAVRWRSAAFSFWSKPVRTSVGEARWRRSGPLAERC